MQARMARFVFSRQLTLAGVRSNQVKCLLFMPRYYFARHCHNSNNINNLINKPVPVTEPIKSSETAASVRHYHTGRHTGSGRRGSIVLGHHVRQALANGCPVVALESTVITHGLPEPNNLELALRLEDEIASGRWWRSDDGTGEASSPASTTNKSDTNDNDDTGAASQMIGQVTPATVGIIRGQLIVGLSRDQLEFLAHTQSSRPIKASRRDIPLAQALGLSAGTTVSATLAIATCVSDDVSSGNKIAVFATGGLGGVHLGGEQSMDISADLYEMARSPMGVVSSGFKSFLDSRRSLEFLETMGCTVTSLRGTDSLYQAAKIPTGHDDGDGSRSANFNKSHQSTKQRNLLCSIDHKRSHLFPGFFSCVNSEQVKSPWQCDSVREAAQILFHCLGPSGGDGRRDLKSMTSSSPPHSDGCKQSNQSAAPSFWLQNFRAMLLASPIPRKFSLDLDNNDGLSGDSGAKSTSASAYGKLMREISDQVDGRQDLSGSEKTPLILAELARRTGGLTLEANLILLRNNARIGAHLAFEYARVFDEHRRVGELSKKYKLAVEQNDLVFYRLQLQPP